MDDEKKCTLQWYALKVRNGKEKSVKEFIESKKNIFGAEDIIDDVFINNKERVRIVNGKKKVTEVNQYGGYIFIHTDIKDQRVIDLLKITPDVTKVGMNKRENSLSAHPLSKVDVDKIFKTTNKSDNDVVSSDSFVTGSMVKIKEGPFAGFNGKIVKIDEKTQSLVLAVSIFSRDTDVNASFSDVEIF